MVDGPPLFVYGGNMKKIKLYASNGYFNAKEIINLPYNFQFITGARATGKTFSTIMELIKRKKQFILLRRTQDESDLQASELTSSVTKVLHYLGVDFEFTKIHKKVGLILVNGQPLIYTCALSTFASIRGVNFDDVEYAVYDEFITEPHVRPFKAEGLALKNFYESVNRNRELEKRKALKMICLSNSLNIANDIFMEFGLVDVAEKLLNSDDMFYFRNSIMLCIMKNSPISKLKEQTTLYENAGEEYAKMAIKNEFILNDFTYVKKEDLKQYRPILSIGDLVIFRKKTGREYYCCFSKTKAPKRYNTNLNDLERLKRAEWRLFNLYRDGKIRFENYKSIALFEKYFK